MSKPMPIAASRVRVPPRYSSLTALRSESRRPRSSGSRPMLALPAIAAVF
jgi:hypothetical protein